MITRIFTLSDAKNTQAKALHLAQFLSKKKGRIQIDQFTKSQKTSLQDWDLNDLKKLFFLGGNTGMHFGEFTALEFAADLAKGIWPPVDRMLVQDLYFIAAEENLTEANVPLIQELTNELAKSGFARATVHALTYKQAMKDKAGSVLQSAEYTYKPKESPADRSKRIAEQAGAAAKNKTQSTAFLGGLRSQEEKIKADWRGPSNSNELSSQQSFFPSAQDNRGYMPWVGGVKEIPPSLVKRTEGLVSLLEEEIKQLRVRALNSCFTYFIRYELNTKIKKQNCLKDLLKARTLEQLQQKAKEWSEEGSVLRHWRNTCTKSWGQSRTKDLLGDIVNNPYKETPLRAQVMQISR